MIRVVEQILHQLRLVVYPIIYGEFCISSGAGFLPLTVLVTYIRNQRWESVQLALLQASIFAPKQRGIWLTIYRLKAITKQNPNSTERLGIFPKELQDQHAKSLLLEMFLDCLSSEDILLSVIDLFRHDHPKT